MDWSGVISNLIEHGMSQSEIAKKVGLTPPSIIDITSGRQRSVKWEVGSELLKLQSKVAAAKRKAA